MKNYLYTDEQEINEAFFRFHQTTRAGQDYASNPDTRRAFCNFAEYLALNGDISDELAREVTLTKEN